MPIPPRSAPDDESASDPSPAPPSAAHPSDPLDAAAQVARRRMLIALSTARLSADTVCRLAKNLDLWWPPPDGNVPPALACEVGVRPADLELAKQVATRADGLAEAELRVTAAVGGAILTLADEDYPNPLLELELPPPAIWIRGTLAPPAPAVAIVGPRNADAWALDATRHFASELAAAGLCIVSGFARGVDACAHQAALDAGGRTLAVLGSGLGVPYPRHHHPLGDAIAHSGALLSEHPCGRAPQPWHFPIRNRLIAALSFATLVIQASSRSGTLITARQALDLGRDVYALPGRITDARCQGSNRLLRDGALMALDPGSLLEGLPSSVQEQLRQSRPLPAALSGAPVDEVACTLANGVESAEGLSRRLHLPIEDVWVSLLELELAQRVRRLAGGLFEWIP